MHRVVLSLGIGMLALSLLFGCASPADAPTTSGPTTAGSSSETTAPPQGWGSPDAWTQPWESGLDPADFVEGVDNAYWPLVPGSRWVYATEGAKGKGRIEVSVLGGIKIVAGIPCVVVRSAEESDSSPSVEKRDFYAQDKQGNVWHMGSDVRETRGGKMTATDDSWEAGVDGAKPGILLWATPAIGEPPYYQAFYPDVVERLARDLRGDASVSVPFSNFMDLLLVEEWTPLDPADVRRVYYSQGLGPVKEESVRGPKETVVLIEYTAP